MAAKATTPKPTRINPDLKLTAAAIAVLGVLHDTGKYTTADDISQANGSTIKATTTVLNKLKEQGLVEANDKGNWKFAGLRCKALGLLVDTLRMNGSPMTASEIGSALWADPKTVAKDAKASVRYIAPAGAVLKTAFTIGAVYRIEQEGTVPKFGLVA